MKKLNIALLSLGLGFLAYLVWRVGPVDLARQVLGIGWGVIPLILTEGAANLAHTVAWRHCIGEARGRVPLWRLFLMTNAGFAVNYLTPTASVGGDVSRAALLATTCKGPEAVSSVFLDKLMTAVAHLGLAVLGSVFLLWRFKLPIELWVTMAVTTGLLTGGMVVLLLLQKHGKMGSICRWLVEHNLGGPAVQKAAQQISKVDEALKHFYREHPRDLVLSVGWHLVGHSAAILQAWLFLNVMDQPAPLATAAAAGFLSLWFDLLTFAVPMNLGTLEGSRIVVFKALGCQALLGMTFGLAIRIAQVFWACFGLVSYARLAVRKSGPAADLPSASLARVGRHTAELPHGSSASES
jgi:uncharacterized protein (TIRG00374 family)